MNKSSLTESIKSRMNLKRKELDREEHFIRDTDSSMLTLLAENKGKQKSVKEALEHYTKLNSILKKERKSLLIIHKKLKLELTSFSRKRKEYREILTDFIKKGGRK